MKDLVNTKLDSNLSGFEIARNISSKYQKEELHIIKKNGKFLDHYNSERKVIKLSPEVFDGTDKYAFYVALNVALTTNSAKNSQCELLKITRFLVISSYIIIIIGSFINNSKIFPCKRNGNGSSAVCVKLAGEKFGIEKQISCLASYTENFCYHCQHVPACCSG